MSDSRKPLIPLVEREGPFLGFLDKIRDKFGFRSGKAIKTQDELVESFRSGLAEGLNLPLRVISEENTRLWFVGFIRAFINPELRSKVALNAAEIRELGRLLGLITRESYNQYEAIKAQESSNLPNRRKKDDSKPLGIIPP